MRKSYLEQQKEAELAALQTLKDQIGFEDIKAKKCDSGMPVMSCSFSEVDGSSFNAAVGLINPVMHRHFKAKCDACGKEIFQCERADNV